MVESIIHFMKEKTATTHPAVTRRAGVSLSRRAVVAIGKSHLASREDVGVSVLSELLQDAVRVFAHVSSIAEGICRVCAVGRIDRMGDLAPLVIGVKAAMQIVVGREKLYVIVGHGELPGKERTLLIYTERGKRQHFGRKKIKNLLMSIVYAGIIAQAIAK